MTRRLSPASTLDILKKEARRWLRALRIGDERARARLNRAHPMAPVEPGGGMLDCYDLVWLDEDDEVPNPEQVVDGLRLWP